VSFVDETLTRWKSRTAPALVDDGESLSYRELDSLTRDLGRTLHRLGVRPGDRVALISRNTGSTLTWILALARAGITYVPLDPSSPIPRTLWVVADSRPTLSIAEPEWLEGLTDDQKASFEGSITSLPALGQMPDLDVRPQRDAPPSLGVVYVIYTSGSTGSPKGVMIRERSLEALVGSACELAGYRSDARYLGVCPYFFDGSVTDLYCPLAVGATHFVQRSFRSPAGLVRSLREHQITDTLLPSTVVRSLASRFSGLSKGGLPKLRTLWFGGEGCPITVLEEIKRCVPQVRLVHGYGPTEATHTATAYVCDELDAHSTEFLPIGRALPTTRTLVVHPEGRRAVAGEVGELLIGGVQVMEGYWNDPSATDRVLVDDPCGEPGTYYRTGDEVLLDDEGLLHFRGRLDDQVKTRGYRVSTTEVERELMRASGVLDAHVIAIPDPDTGHRLVAYLVEKPDSESTIDRVRGTITSALPRYMIPSEFLLISLEDLPRTSNGKVDRKRLVAHHRELHGGAPH